MQPGGLKSALGYPGKGKCRARTHLEMASNREIYRVKDEVIHGVANVDG